MSHESQEWDSRLDSLQLRFKTKRLNQQFQNRESNLRLKTQYPHIKSEYSSFSNQKHPDSSMPTLKTRDLRLEAQTSKQTPNTRAKPDRTQSCKFRTHDSRSKDESSESKTLGFKILDEPCRIRAPYALRLCALDLRLRT